MNAEAMTEKPSTNPSAKEPAHAKPKGHEEPSSATGNGESPAPLTTKEFERLKDEVKQAKDQYLRTLAEFDNTKKRLHREKEEFVRYASETMIRELLPIVDSLDQALVAVDKQSDPQAIIKGVHLIYRQLLGLLSKEGVTRISTVGEPFDPHRHEAVAQVETDDGSADNTVVEEVQVGYTMHDQVIRPAMVKVGKKAATSDKQQATRKHDATEEHPRQVEEDS